MATVLDDTAAVGIGAGFIKLLFREATDSGGGGRGTDGEFCQVRSMFFRA